MIENTNDLLGTHITVIMSLVLHAISSTISPPFWENRSLFADLYASSLHGLSEHGSKGNMHRQLTTDFLSLDSNQNVSIRYFLQ